MNWVLHLSLLLNFVLFTTAQYYPAGAAASSLSPAMASSVSSFAASLATGAPQNQGGQAGDASSSAQGSSSANEAGASGSDNESFSLSKGGMIAIIVVVAVVVIFGIVSSILFYLAKKRSWEVRATLRKSARRVVTALTPRRSEFPSSVKTGRRSSRGLIRIDEVPPTPRLRSQDLEKANAKLTEFEMTETVKKPSKWGRKSDR